MMIRSLELGMPVTLHHLGLIQLLVHHSGLVLLLVDHHLFFLLGLTVPDLLWVPFCCGQLLHNLGGAGMVQMFHDY